MSLPIGIASSSTESLSALLGWISIACWLLVYTPQIYENWLHKSGEGVSTVAVLIWMVGDLTNLFGAAKQHLLETMIILSIYHTLCDLILLLQIFYYRRYHRQKAARSLSAPGAESGGSLAVDGAASEPSGAETTPLLSAQNRGSSRPETRPSASISSRIYSTLSYCSQGLPSFFTAYGLILFIGVLGWSLSRPPRTDPRQPAPSLPEVTETWDLTAQIMGWISALAYLGGRIPQISKNKVTKCRGLSLLFFFVGITGDLAYVASILVVDRSPEHILINLSWLVGSGAVVLVDLIVLYQFWTYRHAHSDPSMPIHHVTGPGNLE